jgi:uncharacterized tellurite resistance protein B-like protein
MDKEMKSKLDDVLKEHQDLQGDTNCNTNFVSQLTNLLQDQRLRLALMLWCSKARTGMHSMSY